MSLAHDTAAMLLAGVARGLTFESFETSTPQPLQLVSAHDHPAAIATVGSPSSGTTADQRPDQP